MSPSFRHLPEELPRARLEALPDHLLRSLPEPDRAARELVLNVQRMWLIAAVTRAAREGSADMITARGVCSRAGVTESTFYVLFDDIDTCVAEAFTTAVAVVAGPASQAYRRDVEWAEKICGGLIATLRVFAEEPELASMCLAEPPERRGEWRRRRQEILNRLCELLERSPNGRGALRRQVLALALSVALDTAAGGIGGPQPRPIGELARELLEILLAPYIGQGPLPRSACCLLAGIEEEPLPPRMGRASLGMRLARPFLEELAGLASGPDRLASEQPRVLLGSDERDEGER